MDHIRHAPETTRHHAPERLVPEPWPATLQDVRIKQSDTQSVKLDVPVPLDANKGITARLRLFRPDLMQTDPSVSYQIVPDNVPLEAYQADKSAAEDPLKHVVPGTFTVHLPDGSAREIPVPTNVIFDLTKGLDIRCSIGYGPASPVGPMLNIDLTVYPAS
jgi:hypothetical protein